MGSLGGKYFHEPAPGRAKMDEDRPRDAPQEAVQDPEERAVSGHPDHPPQQPDHTVENDRDLLKQAEDGPGAAR